MAAHPRAGDALAELLKLPAAWADNLLALRLKLAAVGLLGCQDEYAKTLVELNRSRPR